MNAFRAWSKEIAGFDPYDETLGEEFFSTDLETDPPPLRRGILDVSVGAQEEGDYLLEMLDPPKG